MGTALICAKSASLIVVVVPHRRQSRASSSNIASLRHPRGSHSRRFSGIGIDDDNALDARRTVSWRQTWRRNKTPPPSTTHRCARRPTRANPYAASSKAPRIATSSVGRSRARSNRIKSHRRAAFAPRSRRAPRGFARIEFTCIPSRAKLIPSAGSGSSGGTSSAGNCTSHVPSGLPYRHKFSLSGSHCA